jgi:phage/plasmid-associated DNA primase
MIVAGDDIAGEKKFKDAFNFRNKATLWFSANEIPKPLTIKITGLLCTCHDLSP